MKLVKLQDLSNRPITSTELMTRYIFGDRFPNKFELHKFYQAGDYVYTGDKTGQITVHYCIKSGTYSTITAEGWITASIPTLIREQVEQFIVDNDIHLSINNKYSTSCVSSIDDYEYLTYTNDDLIIDGNYLNLPFKYNKHRHDVEVYMNGVRLFEIDDGFSIVGRRINIHNVTVTDSDKFIVNVLHKNTAGSRLIYKAQRHPVSVIHTTKHTVKVHLDKKYLDKSLVFNMYYNGKYISEEDYTFHYDYNNNNYVIESTLDSGRHWTNNNLVFDFMFSLSKEVSLIKHDIRRTVRNDMDGLKLDMKYTDFNDVSKIYTCYDGMDIIPNTATTLYNDYVHVTDPDYRVKNSDFTLSYILLVFTSIYDTDIDGSNDYYDYIHLPDECFQDRKLPVPFTEFNRTNSDMIVFKNAGTFISPLRYYVDKDNVLTFLETDTSLHKDDIIRFHLFDNDYSIHTYAKHVRVDRDIIEYGYRVPMLDFSTDYFDLMIFYENGAYISSNKYTVIDNIIRFNKDSGIIASDDICILMLEYCLDRTTTVMKKFSMIPTSPTTIHLPYIYDAARDNVLILTEDGAYLDESRYSLSAYGRVDIKSGTEFNMSKTLDIIVFRHIDEDELISQVPVIRKNFL